MEREHRVAAYSGIVETKSKGFIKNHPDLARKHAKQTAPDSRLSQRSELLGSGHAVRTPLLTP